MAARGTPGKRRPSQLECTAYHEAGHAVAAIHLGQTVKRVSIVPREEDETLGRMTGRKPPGWFEPDVYRDSRHRDWIEGEVLVLLVGGLAEARLKGQRNRVGAGGDYQAVLRLTGYLCGSKEEEKKYLDWLHCRARGLLDAPGFWRAVKDVAAELLREQEISGRRARAIYRAGIQREFDDWQTEAGKLQRRQEGKSGRPAKHRKAKGE